MGERRDDDPFVNFLFRIEVEDVGEIRCSECSGLSLEVATEEYHEGGENRFTWTLPSQGRPPLPVLKRGIAQGTDLWDWFVQWLEEGTVAPKEGEVHLLSSPEAGSEPLRVWAFTGGFPVKWTGPELQSLSPEVAFETIEIAHRGIRIRE